MYINMYCICVHCTCGWGEPLRMCTLYLWLGGTLHSHCSGIAVVLVTGCRGVERGERGAFIMVCQSYTVAVT